MAGAISLESTLRASRQQVWEALTDPDARAEWWPGLTFENVSGGVLRERWSQDDVDYITRGIVNDIVPNELLRFSWSDATWEAATTVTVTLQQHGSTTLVRVTEEGLAALSNGAEVAREHEAGWRWHLDQLREHTESR